MREREEWVNENAVGYVSDEEGNANEEVKRNAWKVMMKMKMMMMMLLLELLLMLMM